MSAALAPLDRGHLDRILAERIPPPPLTAKDAAKFAERQPLVEMGFPTLRKDPAPQCAAAAVSLDRPPVWAATTYTCPRCETRVAAIPTECPVCDLPLVSAPHLARSHHHLFPVPMFVEKPGEGECFGCRAALAAEARRARARGVLRGLRRSVRTVPQLSGVLRAGGGGVSNLIPTCFCWLCKLGTPLFDAN